MKLTKSYLKKLIKEEILKEMDDEDEGNNPHNLKNEWPVGKLLMIVAPSDGEAPSVRDFEDEGRPFPTKLGAYDAYIAKVKVVEVVTESDEY